MKNRIIEAIDANREEIFACGEYILNNPELGYKEFKTSDYIKNEFKKLGIPFQENLAVTGVMGDLSNIIPAIQPTLGGFEGALHSKEFSIADKELVYITASKILACTVYDLIKDNGKTAKMIKENFQPNA